MESLKKDSVVNSSSWEFIDDYEQSDEAVLEKIKNEVIGECFNIGDMDYEEFSGKLKMINSFSRGMSSALDYYDASDDVNVDGNFNIKSEHRDNVYRSLLESVQKLPNNEAAALMFYGINKIHGFADGNGRTSRVVSDIIMNNGILSGNNVIGHNGDLGKSSSSRINRYLIDFDKWDNVAEYFLRKLFDNDTTRLGFIYDNDYNTSELPKRSYSGTVSNIEPDYGHALYLNNPNSWKKTTLSSGRNIIKFHGSLNDYTDEDKERIEDLQSGVKIAKLQIIEDLFIYPEKFENIIDNGVEISIKDYLMKNSEFIELQNS